MFYYLIIENLIDFDAHFKIKGKWTTTVVLELQKVQFHSRIIR